MASDKKRSKGSGSRELIDAGTDKRYVRRDSKERFEESDDIGRSLSKANKHMERAWGKIYDRESNGRAVSRKH